MAPADPSVEIRHVQRLAFGRSKAEDSADAFTTEDPVRFVRHDGLMLIDEVQRVPDLWLAIKHLVDPPPQR